MQAGAGISVLRTTVPLECPRPPTTGIDTKPPYFSRVNVVFVKKFLSLFFYPFSFFVSAGGPPFGHLPYIVTPEGKILGQSGSVTKYICKKGGDLSTQGPHSHILMTERSEGFFWVWHFGQKGFFWVYERRRDFLGSRKQHRDVFGYCIFHQLKSTIA